MFNLELARQYTTKAQSEEFVVDFNLVWRWLGYSTKGNAKRKFEKAGFIEGVDFQIIIRNDNNSNQAGAPTHHLALTVDCVKSFSMMANTDNGNVVRKYFIEAEKELKTLKQNQPKLPQTYLEALEALVASEREKEMMALEMASLEEDNLRQAEAIDELFNYSSIIRIAKFNNVSETFFSWRVLKAGSQALKLEIKKVPCPRFGEKNLYSHDVWRYCYPSYKLPETTTLVIQN